MIVRIVAPAEYFAALPVHCHIYGTEPFTGTTYRNAECVRYALAFDENGKARFGIILGYRDGRWHAPYSAPFTEIAHDGNQQLERIYDFISELTDMLGAPLDISLPPDFYDPVMLPKITGVLANYAEKKYFDFDYYYPLERYPQYVEQLNHSARKNFNRAMTAGFVFEKTDDIKRAYTVIQANRQSHGYPLAMTYDQVVATAAAIQADFFVMSHDGVDVAAAVVYHVADGIVQVIYWGDAPGHTELRPMNILPYHLFGHYHKAGYRIVDVGPSSTAGIPNSGLCRFKESIGCMVALKPSMSF